MSFHDFADIMIFRFRFRFRSYLRHFRSFKMHAQADSKITPKNIQDPSRHQRHSKTEMSYAILAIV